MHAWITCDDLLFGMKIYSELDELKISKIQPNRRSGKEMFAYYAWEKILLFVMEVCLTLQVEH